MDMQGVELEICQPLKKGELFAFYKRNNICEEGYGKELAEVVLEHESVWVTAHRNGELIGFARALYDGLHGEIMEIDLDLRYQDGNEFENGCFIESDPHGIARDMALMLIKELRGKGCYFFSALEFGESKSSAFYESLGFCENVGHKNYVIDARPYVPGGDDRRARLDAL